MTSDAPDEALSELDAGTEVLAGTAIGALGLAWFLVSWLMLDSPLIDAVVEASGGVCAVLVVVSVVGAVWQSRDL